MVLGDYTLFPRRAACLWVSSGEFPAEHREPSMDGSLLLDPMHMQAYLPYLGRHDKEVACFAGCT